MNKHVIGCLRESRLREISNLLINEKKILFIEGRTECDFSLIKLYNLRP